MGCDIHLTYQQRDLLGDWQTAYVPTDTWGCGPLDYRSYDMFAFLADVRNYSSIEPISEARGYPEGFGEEDRYDYRHTASWLMVNELLEYPDYDKMVVDRRAPPEQQNVTLREFLGEKFFEDLATLKRCGVERIVFDFDS